MDTVGSAVRRAVGDDAPALRDLERAANLAALGHVFPPERFPFPDDAVLTRWALVLEDPETVVEVQDAAEGGLAQAAAYDRVSLRHLCVHPDRWGEGLAAAAVARAVAHVRGLGEPRIHLWCLTDNLRARGLYARLDWQPTGRTRPAAWPPYPQEGEWAREV